MPHTTKPPEIPSRARRHFLGLAAVIGTRVATMGVVGSAALSSSAQAKSDNGNAYGRGHGKGNPFGGGGGGGGANCFLRGTAIQTPSGEVRIEELRIGDLVETVRGVALPIKWIGRQVYRKSGSAWPKSVTPIRVARGALDEQTPHRDLYLSPMHALYLEGILIPAKELVNGSSIAPGLPDDRTEIEYLHILLDSHEAVLAEGAAAETFRSTTLDPESFSNFVEYERLYAGQPWPVLAPFAPLVTYSGREHLKALLRLGVSRFVPMTDPLTVVHERLDARAEELAS